MTIADSYYSPDGDFWQDFSRQQAEYDAAEPPEVEDDDGDE